MDSKNRQTSLVISIILNVVLILVSVSISLVVIESILRLKNSSMQNYDIEMWKYARKLKTRSKNLVLSHEHLPLQSAVLQSVTIRTNEKGLRGGPVPPRDNSMRRILFLGSSITLGWGVEEENTFTAVLEKLFSRDGKKVEVLNAGIGNYNTVRYVEHFLTNLKSLEPSDIVIHYFINDAEILNAGNSSFLLRHSQLAVTLWIAYNRYLGIIGKHDLNKHYREVYKPTYLGFIAMKNALKQLSEYADQHGIRLYLAMTPDIHNLDNYPFVYIHDIMKDVAEEYHYRYFDLLPYFKGISAETLWAMEGDPHPNAQGHKLMADILYQNAFRE